MAYQLAGAKKVQQDLAAPGVLERFLDSEADAQLLRSCFAGAPTGADHVSVTSRVRWQPRSLPCFRAFVLKPWRDLCYDQLYGHLVQRSEP